MSHFTFLKPEWPEIFIAAAKAEQAVNPDPRTACFYANRSGGHESRKLHCPPQTPLCGTLVPRALLPGSSAIVSRLEIAWSLPKRAMVSDFQEESLGRVNEAS